jgi:hypothetical protein
VAQQTSVPGQVPHGLPPLDEALVVMDPLEVVMEPLDEEAPLPEDPLCALPVAVPAPVPVVVVLPPAPPVVLKRLVLLPQPTRRTPARMNKEWVVCMRPFYANGRAGVGLCGGHQQGKQGSEDWHMKPAEHKQQVVGHGFVTWQVFDVHVATSQPVTGQSLSLTHATQLPFPSHTLPPTLQGISGGVDVFTHVAPLQP